MSTEPTAPADIWLLLVEPGTAVPQPGTRLSFEVKQLPLEKGEYAFSAGCLVWRASELRALSDATLTEKRALKASPVQYAGEHSAQIDWLDRAEKQLKSAQPKAAEAKQQKSLSKPAEPPAERGAARAVQVVPVLKPFALQAAGTGKWKPAESAVANLRVAQPWLAPGGVQVVGTSSVPWHELPADAMNPGHLARKRVVRPGVEIMPSGDQARDEVSQDELADTRTALRLDRAPGPSGGEGDVNAPGIDQGRFGDVQLGATPATPSAEDTLSSLRQRLHTLDRRLRT